MFPSFFSSAFVSRTAACSALMVLSLASAASSCCRLTVVMVSKCGRHEARNSVCVCAHRISPVPMTVVPAVDSASSDCP
jgi:hypothetical protein